MKGTEGESRGAGVHGAQLDACDAGEGLVLAGSQLDVLTVHQA